MNKLVLTLETILYTDVNNKRSEQTSSLEYNNKFIKHFNLLNERRFSVLT